MENLFSQKTLEPGIYQYDKRYEVAIARKGYRCWLFIDQYDSKTWVDVKPGYKLRYVGPLPKKQEIIDAVYLYNGYIVKVKNGNLKNVPFYNQSGYFQFRGDVNKSALRELPDNLKNVTLENNPFIFYQKPELGADPEFFLGKDKLIPAFTVLPSKEKPIETYYTQAYWDGFQAEFRQKRTRGTCLAWLVDDIQEGIVALSQRGPIMAKTTVDLLPEHKEVDPKFLEFGCTPSLNVYGMHGAKVDGKYVDFRMAGGHMHFGNNNWRDSEIINHVKSLDRVLGVASVAGIGELDDPRRRMLYGLAGEYRRPKYGFEYRVLSNAYLYNPIAVHIMYELARYAIAVGQLDYKFIDISEDEVITIINTNDVGAAREMMKRFERQYMEIFNKINGRKAPKIYKLFVEGFQNHLNMTDIEKNWFVKGGWQSHSEKANIQNSL